MTLVMWMGTALQARRMMWVSLVLTVTYAIVMALEFYPPRGFPLTLEWLVFTQGFFAGPMIIASVLSLLIRRLEARRVMVVSQVGYIFVTLAVFYSTFTGEHDAQYQLALLFIPVFGFIGAIGAGIVAACLR
jgi:nitrate reductase gamma subunit